MFLKRCAQRHIDLSPHVFCKKLEPVMNQSIFLLRWVGVGVWCDYGVGLNRYDCPWMKIFNKYPNVLDDLQCNNALWPRK